MQLTKEKILESVAKNKQYQEFCRLVCRDEELYMDLFQEMLLALHNYPEETLVQSYKDEKIRWLIGRIILNLNSKTGSFYKLYFKLLDNSIPFNEYIRISDDLDPYIQEEQNQIIENKLDAIKTAYDNSTWYEQAVLKIWLQEGSFRKVEKETGVSYFSVFHTVKQIKERVKKHYGKDQDSGCSK